MAEASLLKAARALDQDGPETVASKLVRFWTALAATAPAADAGSGGRFHAAEAIALRWLLKNMAGGSTPEAETLRRWPLTWHILGSVLRRIPLFSLAKALADRRFIAVLQQTARDLATPTPTPTEIQKPTAATASPEPGSRKRKRAHGPDASPLHLDDLATLRTPRQCLVSAAALFAALRALLARLDREEAVPEADDGGRPGALAYEHMGAEHIKTLFSMPAADAMALLVPLLRIGNMALTTGGAHPTASGAEDTEDTEDTLAADEAEAVAAPPVDVEGQADWLSVFAALWDLHAPGPTDAVEVATHLAPFGFAMLGRLQARTAAAETTTTTATQRRWTAALRRFLTNNVVLPARAAFLNRNDTQILAIAAGDPTAGGGSGGSSGSTSSSIDAAVLRSSVLLGLALRAPTPLLAAAAARDNALWLRILLDKILEPFLAAEAAAAATMDPRRRNGALASLLELAARHGVAPSAKTLRWIAGHAALGETGGRPRKGKKGRRGEAAAAPEDGADHHTAAADTAPDAAVDWRLMAAVARCDADIFLVSRSTQSTQKTQGAGSEDNGGDGSLLDTVLGRLAASAAADADREHAAQFLVALARAFAKARNLAGFVVRWYASLAATADAAAAATPWLHPDIRSAVAGALQPSLTKEQLLALLDQVLQEETDEAAKGDRRAVVVARLVVLDALSAGVSLEEYEDAVQTKMADAVVGGDGGPVPASASAMRWRLVRRTLAWVGAADAERLWTLVRADLTEGEEQGDDSKADKKKKKCQSKKQRTSSASSAEQREAAFEAFVCAFSFWMVLKLSGPAEDDARATTWRLFERFSEELAGLVGASDGGNADGTLLRQEVARRIAAYRNDAPPADTTAQFATRPAAAATYLAWMLCGSSRFVDEMVKSSSEPSRFLDALVAWQAGRPPSSSSSSSSCPADVVSAALFGNATSLQNSTVTETVAARYVQQLEAHAASAARPREALLGLLRMPSHLLARPLRETIVALLLPATSDKTAAATAAASLEETVLVLDLLTRVLLRDRAASGSVDLARLRPLGEAVHAAVAAAPRPTALGVLDRLQRLATIVACRAAATGSGGADKDWFLSSATPVELQLLFLRAQVTSLSGATTTTATGGTADDTAKPLQKAQERLASLIVKQLLRHLEQEADATDDDVVMAGTADADSAAGPPRPAMPPVPVLLALEAALADDGLAVEAALRQQKKLGSVVKKAAAAADRLCRRSEPVGWKWKAFHVRYAAVAPPREVRFDGLFGSPQQQPPALPLFATPASVLLDSDLLRAYLAAATRNSSPEALLAYVQDLIAALPLQREQDQQPQQAVAPLFAVQYLLDRCLAEPLAAALPAGHGPGSGGLAAVHSQLVQRLPRARTAVECRLLAQTLRTLLVDDKVAAAAMGQWNVDATLSAVAVLVGSGGRALSAPAAYDDACGLVEAVLKRHRVRLEGRFHLLVRTLQALLARLVAGHQEALRTTRGGGAKRARHAGADEAVPAPPPADWTPQAKRFSRLLELVCEPSTAAVTRMAAGGAAAGSGSGPAALLHSATDTAKRSAGQHMYLVLMTYLKLQIDGAVVLRSVREALEPGLFSVLTITTDETRRLLNDAVDAGGRALFRDLYRRWLQFGKWRGV